MSADITGLRAYHTARGNPGPASALDSDATASLQRGTDTVSRMFNLSSDLTHVDVIDAIYFAAGYELSSAGALVAYPGFWMAEKGEKILTAVDGIKWTLREEENYQQQKASSLDTLRFMLNGHGTLRLSTLNAQLRAI